MLEVAKGVVVALNALSPLGLAAGLSFVIYMLVKNSRSVATISDNHLSGLPDMAASLDRIEKAVTSGNDLLVQLVADISYLKGRVNGRS